MLFNSPAFLLLFLPVTLLLFYVAGKTWGGRAAHAVLIAASCVFYAWWDWRYLALLLASTGANFWLGGKLMLHKRKALLVAGIVANTGVLGYFKYTDFAIQNFNAITGMGLPMLNIVLPLGISFFTFQKIGYLVDCFKGNVHDRDPVRFCLFVMFFPQLVAGPIVHHDQIIPQLKQHQASPFPTADVVSQGLFYLTLGLFKKVIIADNIAGVVVPGFANVGGLELIEAWTVAIGYSLQLYFDFSAYSEMAIGLALLFGIRLPINFNSPYKAHSITDFWRRWHITLGAFMRQYIYIPLGGNKNGQARMLAASMATMLIGGLWHGAAWTFVVWGLLHGLMLLTHKLWSAVGIKLNVYLARGLTMVCVVFAWVPFRANSLADTVAIWGKMLGIGRVTLPASYQNLPLVQSMGTGFHLSTIHNGSEILALCVLLCGVMTWSNLHELWQAMEPKLQNALYLVGAGLASLFSLSKPSMFLYFSF